MPVRHPRQRASLQPSAQVWSGPPSLGVEASAVPVKAITDCLPLPLALWHTRSAAAGPKRYAEPEQVPHFHVVSAEEGEQNPEHPKEEAPLKEKLQLGDGLVYESYDPLRLKQNEAQELLPFPTFDAALDEFYAKVSHHAGPLLRTAAASHCSEQILVMPGTIILASITPDVLDGSHIM